MKLTRLIAAALTAVCIFTLTSCKQEDTQTTANDYPVHVADTVVDHRPKKVVSLAPALTDALFQLQIAGRVVAISDYCDLPAQPGDLEYYEYPRAGTQQLPDIDAIKELGADLVLMTAQPTDAVALEAPAGQHRLCGDPARLGSGRGAAELCGSVPGCSMVRRPAPKWQREYLVPFDHKLAEIQSCLDAAGEKNISAVYVAGGLLQIATGDSFEGYILELLGTQNWGADYTNYSYPQEKEVDLNPM